MPEAFTPDVLQRDFGWGPGDWVLKLPAFRLSGMHVDCPPENLSPRS